MRTVTYGGACSLDGFIAGRGGDMEWLHFSPDVAAIIESYWKTIDTLLMGRKTWDVAQSQAGGDAGGGSSGGGAGYGGVRTFVFSRTLTAIGVPGVTLVRDNAGDFVRALKRERGKGICVLGGGDLARSLLEADVIDEVGFNVHPVLLGAGSPGLLDAGRRVNLELKECRTLPGGCVYVTYRVKHPRAKTRTTKPSAR